MIRFFLLTHLYIVIEHLKIILYLVNKFIVKAKNKMTIAENHSILFERTIEKLYYARKTLLILRDASTLIDKNIRVFDADISITF